VLVSGVDCVVYFSFLIMSFFYHCLYHPFNEQGITFGSRVFDRELSCFSFRNEVISLAISIFIGVLIGLCCSFAPQASNWPTPEMAGRGDVLGLITGMAIAIPSGMGVALSILGNNTSSLVGVAISASLLPPAVNAGICWIHGMFRSLPDVVIHNNRFFSNCNLFAHSSCQHS
jgi:hypothetical protein